MINPYKTGCTLAVLIACAACTPNERGASDAGDVATPIPAVAPNIEAASSAIAPACEDELYRQFDFWVGTWDVAQPDGTYAGRNVITMEEGGCLLVERWVGAQGGTGQSYNYVDRDTGQWRQIWVSAGFTIDYSGGLNMAGAMALEGRIGYALAAPNNSRFRGTWTLREDGTVEQFFEQFNEKTDEWTPWFTGIYSKVTENE